MQACQQILPMQAQYLVSGYIECELLIYVKLLTANTAQGAVARYTYITAQEDLYITCGICVHG